MRRRVLPTRHPQRGAVSSHIFQVGEKRKSEREFGCELVREFEHWWQKKTQFTH